MDLPHIQEVLRCKKQFIYENRSKKEYTVINRKEQWMSLMLMIKPPAQNRSIKASCW